jgi:AraC-like DNA-binding protein
MIDNIIKDKTSEHQRLFMMYYGEDYILSLYQFNNDNYLKVLLENIQDFFLSKFELLFSYALQNKNQWSKLSSCFNYVLSKIKFSSTQGLIFCSDYKAIDNSKKKQETVLADIISAVHLFDPGKVAVLMDEYLSYVNYIEDEQVQTLFITLTRSVFEIANEYNLGEILTVDNLEKMTNLYMFSSVLELKSFFLGVFEVMFGRINNGNNQSSDAVITKVQNYIAENICQRLTLNSISERFNMNPSYLSRVFHQKTNMTLSNYVTESKITQAKKMLSTTSENVYDIASNLGYENANYFSRVFKKSTGMTPQAFRGIMTTGMQTSI